MSDFESITSRDKKVTIELTDGRSMDVHVHGSITVEQSGFLIVSSQLESTEEIWLPLASINMIRGGQVLEGWNPSAG
ncbi:MAG: hypothetical protein R3301_18465 [Saprospiraceae bacterium]|nr:hypothetical protein [Saprospiraceae bacterium]